MKITIAWQKPVHLTRNRRIIVEYQALPNEVEDEPGVYFFARNFGAICISFYIGETMGIRGRLRGHLQSRSIADVLRGITDEKQIKNGTRSFHYGYFVPRQGQQPKPCLKIVQGHLIRHAVEQGWPILNKQLTKIRTHTLTLEGSAVARGPYGSPAIVEA